MATEEYSIGYEAGYQDGLNAAVDETPARVPLTAQDLNDLLDGLSLLDPFAIARAVERAHGIGGGK